jgi:Zn-dependent peptidase ImmA (M78 family)
MNFSVVNLEIARKRRRLSYKQLADAAGISPEQLSRIKNGKHFPEPCTVWALSKALDYPEEFLRSNDNEEIPSDIVSFRSLKAMTARERDAALSAASIAQLCSGWLDQNFSLPELRFPEFQPGLDSESSAKLLRHYWALGEQPIGNIVHLMESRGVRVFSLSENTKNVDAFSFWKSGKPYVFLNSFKTTERSRFDAAHELGHLVMHRHGGPQNHRESETEADEFGSAFLMPARDVRAHIPRVQSLDQLVKLKKRWGVSVYAVIVRTHRLQITREWQYRNLMIQARKRFGSTEPDALPPHKSSLWVSVLRSLWAERRTRDFIAMQNHLPSEEVSSLLFGLTEE